MRLHTALEVLHAVQEPDVSTSVTSCLHQRFLCPFYHTAKIVKHFSVENARFTLGTKICSTALNTQQSLHTKEGKSADCRYLYPLESSCTSASVPVVLPRLASA